MLPEHDALVIDEAHELEDILAASLGVEVSPGRLRALARCSPGGPRRRQAAGRSAGRTPPPPGTVEAVLARPPASRTCSPTARTGGSPPGLGGEIGEQVTLMVDRLERLGVELRRARGGLGRPATGAGAAPAQGGDAAQRCLRALLGVDRCREELAALSCRREATRSSGSPVAARPAMHSAPLDVSEVMSAQVFSADAGRDDERDAAARARRPHRRPAPRPRPSSTSAARSPTTTHGLLYCAVSLPDRRGPRPRRPSTTRSRRSCSPPAGGPLPCSRAAGP